MACLYIDNSLVNTRLVRAGWAHVFILNPFDRADDWLRLQRDAQAKDRGGWGTVEGPLNITRVHANAPGDGRHQPNGEETRSCHSSPRPVELAGFAVQDEKNHHDVFSTGRLRPGYTALLSNGPDSTSVRHGQSRFH